jgi:hypothetical protein
MNRVTLGLLSLLDAQTQGQNPSDLSTNVQPTLDVSPYLYASQRLEVDQGQGIALAIGLNAPVVIPSGQIWLVQAVTSTAAALDAVVGNQIRMWPQVSISSAFNPIPMMETPAAVHTIGSPGQSSVCTCNWRHPGLAFLGGTVFSTQVGLIFIPQVAGVSIETSVLFMRLKV